MSKPRKIESIMPQTVAMLAGRCSIKWNSAGQFNLAAPAPRNDQVDTSRRRFTTLCGIDPRLAELLWSIHYMRKLSATMVDETTKQQAREFISDDEKKIC